MALVEGPEANAAAASPALPECGEVSVGAARRLQEAGAAALVARLATRIAAARRAARGYRDAAAQTEAVDVEARREAEVAGRRTDWRIDDTVGASSAALPQRGRQRVPFAWPDTDEEEEGSPAGAAAAAAAPTWVAAARSRTPEAAARKEVAAAPSAEEVW